MHGGASPGAPKGNSHAFKHGRFTAEAIAERREFAALVREMKGPRALFGQARFGSFPAQAHAAGSCVTLSRRAARGNPRNDGDARGGELMLYKVNV
jgi:hypothetical protein